MDDAAAVLDEKLRPPRKSPGLRKPVVARSMNE
jgi:hypothetical protein